VARGIYERLLGLIPYERWSDSREQLRAALTAAIAPDLIDSVFGQLRRVLLLGQLRARSTELQEDELVSGSDAATKWIVGGPGALSQKADASEFPTIFLPTTRLRYRKRSLPVFQSSVYAACNSIFSPMTVGTPCV